MINKNKVEGEKTAENVTFTKDKIISAKKYKHRIDLLKILLKDGKQYTFDEVDSLLNNFFKKER